VDSKAIEPQSLGIAEIEAGLREQAYIADRSLAVSIFLSLQLGKPLFLEGEAGVGKTELAKSIGHLLNTRLIRLQCYEGLDVNSAVYEWNYSRQMLQIRLLEAQGKLSEKSDNFDLFSTDFLLERPLLQAISPTSGQNAPVLLIDELDRADEEFEAFLLEILSDFQVTIPEIGTLRALKKPVVLITSNRTREIHDALKRRCLYYWVDYPGFDKEIEIVKCRCPQASRKLSQQAVRFVQSLRKEDLFKPPGVSETLDWINALVAMNQQQISEAVLEETLGTLLKYRDDHEMVRNGIATRLLEK
jgi:MoxR-like ATPase